MKNNLLLAVITMSLGWGGCATRNRASSDSASSVGQIFDGMGRHQRRVTTSSAEAQRYFNQGLTWAYAFNHDEAIRAFQRVAEIDPQCAMAWWGTALCHGPHVNNPVMSESRSKQAWDALQKALALANGASEVERALINALAKRYANPAPTDRRSLDEAYAAAMSDAYRRHPDDSDVATLYAEALMDLQPWDYWAQGAQPKGRTVEILQVLERVLARDPGNPGANHLYIHACEAGPHPEKAIASADRLRDAVPIAGHLVHMPSHIDVQVGRWQLAADQNVKAIEADRRYRKLSPRQDFYRIYMAHNHHFLAFASMMEGCHAKALQAAREMVAGVPIDYARENAALIDGAMSIVMDVHMRFGDWQAILDEPKPAEYFPITNANWHFMRGVAQAARGRIDEALAEQSAFVEARRRVPDGAMISVNPAATVLDIAGHVLQGEIAFRRGDIDAAVAALREAGKIEDKLVYMEPPEWMHPTRQILGAFLLDAGRTDDAERVYREELDIWPENGWSLYGLAKCLRAKGAADEATKVEQRFAKAWSRADTKISSSCLCTDATRSAPRGSVKR